MTILTAIPLWVLPLLVALIALGLRARCDRTSPVLPHYLLPLLGLLSLNSAFGLGAIAIATLVPGWSVGLLAGLRLQPRWTMARIGRRVHLRGENVTMVTILGLFALNFALGMATGIMPDVAQVPAIVAIYGVLSGLLSGSLAGRALSIARSPAA